MIRETIGYITVRSCLIYNSFSHEPSINKLLYVSIKTCFLFVPGHALENGELQTK